MKLDEFVTLGRSGLRVSPLCLGTMTFGTDWGWGVDQENARRLFDFYLDAGGNFVDTADGYTDGKSETWLGEMIRDRGLRDRVVLATKFTFGPQPGNPNSGGNGRKNIYRALEGSLRRLRTDYVDLYWLHCWDMLTPIEEVASTLTDLVKSGKVRYVGLSDVPAWYAARYQTLAEHHGWERISALQLEYSLIERSIEREHVPLAQELGMGILPWSPLAGGFLSGKYQRGSNRSQGEGRIEKVKDSPNPVNNKTTKPTEKTWAIVDLLRSIATELGSSPAEVALAWVARQPGITSTIIGATKLSQLASNIHSLELVLNEPQRSALDRASALDNVHPYMLFGEVLQGIMHGGARVSPWGRQVPA